MKQVLSGKTLNKETLDYAHTLDLDVRCIDFIEIEPQAFEIKNFDFDSIAFTSSNAVKFFTKNPDNKILLRTKHIFSLSGKTAGKLDIKPMAIANDADSLADKIIESNSKSVLHPCGNLKLEHLVNKLQLAHISYHPLVVYKTAMNKYITTDKTYDTIMFFSPSGVESFFSVNTWAANTIACCIGETTATTFRGKQKTATVITPKLPTPESMLKTIANYYKKHATEA